MQHIDNAPDRINERRAKNRIAVRKCTHNRIQLIKAQQRECSNQENRNKMLRGQLMMLKNNKAETQRFMSF